MASAKDNGLDIKSLNLYQKLAAITGEVGVIAKDGRNQEQKFDFISYAAVGGRLRELFSKYGVIIIPNMAKTEEHKREEILSKYGAKGVAVQIPFVFKVVNADKPDDSFEVNWTGESADYGDKATNKAATSALKYYLMRQFNISEKGDDPDADTPDRGEASSQLPPKPQASTKKEASEKQRGLIVSLARKAGYDFEWLQGVMDKVRTSADASKIIETLNAKLEETPSEPVREEQIEQIKKLSKEAGAGTDWVANAIMNADTAEEADKVIANLEKQMQKEPTERVWK